MALYTQKSEKVDALLLKGSVQFRPMGSSEPQYGKPGDFLVHRADGSMVVMSKADFEDRFGKQCDMTAAETAARQCGKSRK